MTKNLRSAGGINANTTSVRDQVCCRHGQSGEVPSRCARSKSEIRIARWSEFATGETTLALHPASDRNPAGKVELGFSVADVEAFYRDMSAKGVLFSMPPKKQDFGGVLAQFVDSEGAHCSVGAEAAQ
jgi:uncharacterized glyoxalase superfamily protein PhnB